MEIIKSALPEHEAVYAIDAPNWPRIPGVDDIKIGVTKKKPSSQKRSRAKACAGQFYGIVDNGLIHAEHVFRGLRRSMHVGNNDDAAAEKLAASWLAARDARLVGDKSDATVDFRTAPPDKVFVVYISVNKMLREYPSIYGWAEHWTWVQADPVEIGAPIQWLERYEARIWSAPGL